MLQKIISIFFIFNLYLLIIGHTNTLIAQVDARKAKYQMSGGKVDTLGKSKQHKNNVDPNNIKVNERSFSGFSEQNTIQAPQIKNRVANKNLASNGKVNFELHLNDNFKSQTNTYTSALNEFIRIENFRLVNQRRTIAFENGAGTVELYAANELMQLYGRRIRPQNIKDGQKQIPVEFVISENGVIKEKLIK